MAKSNTDFFVEKKAWSEIKDSLLGCYLKPYFQKLITSRRPILYVDCFAGKGKFDDGNNGSPIIALDIMANCLQSSRMANATVDCVFIELNHADDLRKNLQGYRYKEIISGKYEDNIEEQLRNYKGKNVFLYIDPYGIKALQFAIFQQISSMQLYSCEVLINMNSFGFIREACHALGTTFDIDVSDEIVEYAPTILKQSDKSIQDLNDIAGGDYWKRIILDYKDGKIDGYAAEKKFASMYCNRLRDIFKYVLNMPIRLREGQRPKYRMIHATNHESGCLIMNDNMCKRWEALQDIQTDGQQTMFQVTAENDTLDLGDISNNMAQHVKQFTTLTDIDVVLADFISQYELQCATSEYNKMLAALETANRIAVERNPATTKFNKPSKFWTTQKGQTVRIQCN